MIRTKGMRTALVCVALSSVPLMPLRAADLPTPLVAPPAPPAAEGWSVTLAPYFWAAGISGDVAAFGGPEISISPSFGDILKNLDFAAMAIGEARYGRFSLLGDVLYTKLSVGLDGPRGILADRADITAQTFAGLLGAGYALIQDERGTLDAIGGVRVWSVSNGLSFTGQILDGVDLDDSATWVDGIVGLRARYNLTDSFYFTSWGFIGTGGAKLDWDVAAGIGYRFNSSLSAVLGYRALGVDYESDGFVFNIVQQGPILGMAFRF